MRINEKVSVTFRKGIILPSIMICYSALLKDPKGLALVLEYYEYHGHGLVIACAPMAFQVGMERAA
jgi:hypothetical protein